MSYLFKLQTNNSLIITLKNVLNIMSSVKLLKKIAGAGIIDCSQECLPTCANTPIVRHTTPMATLSRLFNF